MPELIFNVVLILEHPSTVRVSGIMAAVFFHSLSFFVLVQHFFYVCVGYSRSVTISHDPPMHVWMLACIYVLM